MTPELLAHLLDRLAGDPMYVRAMAASARAAGSSWSESQIHLLLACLDDVRIEVAGIEGACARRAGRTEEDDLAAAVAEVVAQAGGGPVPLAEVRRRLPARFVTTEERLRAVIRQTPGIEVFGPGLVRAKR